jgi:hypothetical protein
MMSHAAPCVKIIIGGMLSMKYQVSYTPVQCTVQCIHYAPLPGLLIMDSIDAFLLRLCR